MATKEDVKIRAVDHDCVPDEAGVETKKPFEAKKRAREDNDTPIRQVFQQEFEPLQNKGYELVNHLPQFSNLKSTLDDSRNQSQGLQSEPKQPKDVLLDDDSLKMADGKIFLLADSGETDRILSFAGRKGVEAIKNNKCFFIDGTFKSCSGQFKQIYTIHVDLGSTETETNVVPVVFALLQNKKRNLYSYVSNDPSSSFRMESRICKY